jgi:hypothetical protein
MPTPTGHAMAPTKSATARYRLPNTVVPRTYRLTIEPDSDKLIYNGVVEIDIEVRKPTNEVVLRCRQVEHHSLGACL